MQPEDGSRLFCGAYYTTAGNQYWYPGFVFQYCGFVLLFFLFVFFKEGKKTLVYANQDHVQVYKFLFIEIVKWSEV